MITDRRGKDPQDAFSRPRSVFSKAIRFDVDYRNGQCPEVVSDLLGTLVEEMVRNRCKQIQTHYLPCLK